jgi:hypothetical protein
MLGGESEGEECCGRKQSEICRTAGVTLTWEEEQAALLAQTVRGGLHEEVACCV